MNYGRILLTLMAVVLVSVLMANEVSHSGKAEYEDYACFKRAAGDRSAPEWAFVTEPFGFQTSYYDYMPGSYNGSPLRMQPEMTNTNFTADGLYFTFQAEETAAATRRVYASWVNPDEGIEQTNYCSQQDIKEGYPSVAIDPDMADPFIVWHSDIDNDGMQEILITTDSFHLLGSPGLLQVPEVIIDNDIPACFEVYSRVDNEYNWPYIHIGPSPNGLPHRRLYVVANNYAVHESGYAAHNPIIAYADYDTSDPNLSVEDLVWSYNTIAQMNAWDVPDPDFNQGNHTFFATQNSGTVGFVGYSNSTQNIYAYINDNYGEGEFTEYTEDFKFPQDNVQDQNGEWVFTDEPGVPYTDLYFSFTKCTNFNSTLVNDSRIIFPGNMGLRRDTEDNTFTWLLNLTFAKVYGFDLTSGEFFFSDLYPKGAHPADNTPMVPWDLDEDGSVDEYDEEGNVQMELGWPFYYWDPDDAWDENNWKIARNDEEDWLAIVWQDALYCKLSNDGSTGYEDWVGKSEICIAISKDDGNTWSEPIRMHNNENADDGNYVPQLADLSPCYIYPADEIEYLYTDNSGHKHGLLRMAFYDDNCYGSFVADNGTNDGGELSYMSLDVTFTYQGSEEGGENTPVYTSSLNQNYPNPFNPETTISYSLATPGNVELSVYNIRGQKVKTLIDRHCDAGENTATWNGTDETGKNVSGGVYLYRLQTQDQALTRKMILLK